MQSLLRRVARCSPSIRLASPLPNIRAVSMSSTAYTSSMLDSEPSSTTTTTSNSASDSKPLALPETAHNPSTQLDMSSGGTTVKLDRLGPMVVNVDGSLSRISNWEAMADIEKKNTLRIIGKRNQARLEALRAKDGGN